MADAGLQTKILISTTNDQGVAAGDYVAACLKTANLDENVDLAEVQCFSSTAADVAAGVEAAKRRLAQLFDSSLTLDGNYVSDDAGQLHLKPGTEVYINISINVAKATGVAVNDPYGTIVATVKGIVESRSRTFDVENPNDISVTVQGNGPVDTAIPYSL